MVFKFRTLAWLRRLRKMRKGDRKQKGAKEIYEEFLNTPACSNFDVSTIDGYYLQPKSSLFRPFCGNASAEVLASALDKMD